MAEPRLLELVNTYAQHRHSRGYINKLLSATTSTALNYYTALKFTSNSSFTAAQRPKRILAILEGIFYGRAAADEIFSDSRSAFLLPIGQHSGVRMDHWLGAAHTPKPASLSTGEALPATIRGSTSRYGTSEQVPALDVAGSLAQPVGWMQASLLGEGCVRFGYILCMRVLSWY